MSAARTRTSASKTKTKTVSTPTPTNNPNANPISSNPIPPLAAVSQQAPPADAFTLIPPLGFVQPNDALYRGLLPWLIETAAVPGALQDLSNFADYTSTFGPTAPGLSVLVGALTLADQWTRARKVSAAWDGYAKGQEGLAWLTLRPLLEKLRAIYEIAAAHDPTLRTRLANLNALLSARFAVAKRAASTRALNSQAKAAGKPPIHGKAGKQRKKAADKAIVAAASATPTVTPPPVATTVPATPATPPPATTTPPATPVASPGAAPAAPAAPHA